MIKTKTNRDICLFLAVINIPIYIMGGGTVALVTSLLMFSSCIAIEITDKDV